MDKSQIKQWFILQNQSFKNLVLLQLANELTLVSRNISTLSDDSIKLKAGWVVSECQHKILSYVTAAMSQLDHYPDDVIVEIVFDHIEHQSISDYTYGIWNTAIDHAERFGSALKDVQN